jgi:hypothetical protein
MSETEEDQENYVHLSKSINPKEIVINQDFPLFSSHLTAVCEALILQTIHLIPQSCIQRNLDLKEIIWIPLEIICGYMWHQ